MDGNLEFQSPELRHEMELRLRNILPLMTREGLQAMLVADNANIYYLSGRFYRGYIYLTRTDDALNDDARTGSRVGTDVDVASADTPLSVDGLRVVYFVIRPDVFVKRDDIVAIRKPEQILDELGRLGLPLPDSVGLELDSLTWSEASRLVKAFGNIPAINVSPLLNEARMVKTDFELARMREDGEHQVAVYHRVPRLYKRDMTDIELQVEIERVLRLEGCLGYTRTAGRLMEINMGSVICGDNADAPTPYDFALGGAGQSDSLPVGADGKTIKNGSAVMIDMNGNFNGYQTDMSRVWRVGQLPQLALTAHQCAIDILRLLERDARPGIEVCRLYQWADALVHERNLQDYFMGHRQKAGFIGHGVGIVLNEQPAITPRCRVILKENMTLAIEPKFVIPGVGAVGLENTYVVTRDGLKSLTPFTEEIQDLI